MAESTKQILLDISDYFVLFLIKNARKTLINNKTR